MLKNVRNIRELRQQKWPEAWRSFWTEMTARNLNKYLLSKSPVSGQMDLHLLAHIFSGVTWLNKDWLISDQWVKIHIAQQPLQRYVSSARALKVLILQTLVYQKYGLLESGGNGKNGSLTDQCVVKLQYMLYYDRVDTICNPRPVG